MTASAEPAAGLVAGAPAEEAILGRASAENFSVASLLVGRENRAHLTSIYGFARLVDELGDAARGDRLALLDALEGDLGRAFDGGEPEHAVLRRLGPTVHALRLPREPFLRLIEANRRDQRVSRYETFAELVEYCTFSANPVGELVLHVFGVATPERIEFSDRICTALQIAEHLQDVGEDYRNGRVYLPAEDLARFGVPTEALAEARPSANLRRLLAFEVDRARKLLDAGAPLVRTLRGRARIAVAGYVGGGRAALDALTGSGFDVLSRSPRAGRGRRGLRSLGALV